MKKELKISIELHVSANKGLDLLDITRHIKGILPDVIDKRLEVVNIDKITVLPYNFKEDIDIIPHVVDLIKAIDDNTWELWKPDFSDTVQAVIIEETDIRECDEEGAATYNFKGIDIAKSIIESKLRLEKDYGE
tara:strand:+ start:255 stop:656 length:402 start_codon:yes stop_codon:yes gene_type:complete